MDQKFIEESERCLRYDFTLSVILFDIDKFKRINDNFGHAAGDSALVNIAHTADKLIRRHDILARWGGEEFIVLMPHTSLPAAAKAAEKLRKGIKGMKHECINTAITASFGVTEFMPGETIETCFSRVDYAMFRSKNQGRNRVTALSWDKALPLVQIRIEWKSGHPVIDQQHRMLISLGSQLLDAAFADNGEEEINSALKNLTSHIRTHFDEEKKILEELDYPDTEEHNRIHEDLLKRMDEFILQYQKGNRKSTDIFSFLLDEVIVAHLLKEDVLFFPYLKEHSPCAAV